MVKATFIKAQAASLTASAVDFGTTALLVEVFGVPKVAASAIGTTIGGITNFIIGRVWVFEAAEKKVPAQASKYLLVWVGNLLLNTGGVALMVHGFGVNYLFSKIFVSIIVGFTYNYFLQKKFVFKH